MNKQEIKNHLIQQQVKLIEELKEQVATVHSQVDIDEEDVMDPEDHSHSFESNEMEQMIKVQRSRAERGLEILSSLDISPKFNVETGALIETERLCFFIGYATLPFEAEGTRIVGISTGSPIYNTMTGLNKGDSFSYAGNDYTITNIY